MDVYGQIIYAPVNPVPPNPIPTISETLLIVMAIALAVVAFKMMKSRPGWNYLTSLTVGGLAFFLSLAVAGVISDANANGEIAYLTSPNGGVTNIEYLNNDVHIINNSGNKLKILAITPVACVFHAIRPCIPR